MNPVWEIATLLHLSGTKKQFLFKERVPRITLDPEIQVNQGFCRKYGIVLNIVFVSIDYDL